MKVFFRFLQQVLAGTI